jgi:hypothetical protein
MATNNQPRIKSFFARSSFLDIEVLRPMSHIQPHWELTWNPEEEKYIESNDSYAAVLNALIAELDVAKPPAKYHDNEDCLAEYVVEKLKWPIRKNGNLWVGANYISIIEQGGFYDLNERDLILAAAGRIRAAIGRGQLRYDDMEESHRLMLGAVIAVILYHRTPFDGDNSP